MQAFEIVSVDGCFVSHIKCDGTSSEIKLQISDGLIVDNSYYIDNYGFNLNEYDARYFKLQASLWKYFLDNTDDEWCLIYEKYVHIAEPFEHIEDVVDLLPSGTELFFPFSKISDLSKMSRPKLCTSRFGYFWGSYIYVINREGARKMLTKDIIEKPLDETFLDMALSNNLSTYFCRTNWFVFDELTCKSLIERREDIRDAIFNHSAWTEEQRMKAARILSALNAHASKLGIKLLLHAGTLLGAVRHGGIMPWDNDLDLAINHRDINRFIRSVKKEGILNITKWQYKKTNSSYYKFWLTDGEKAVGYEYKFPFVDIWIVYEYDPIGIRLTDGYLFNHHDYLPPRPVTFEGLKFYTPNKPSVVLDMMYKGWDKEIRVYSWCHRLKKHEFKRLSMSITVDEEGRYIADYNKESVSL